MSSFCICKSYSHYSSKNISVYAILDDQRFNNTLTNNIVSFEQLGPGFESMRSLVWMRQCFIAQSFFISTLPLSQYDLNNVDTILETPNDDHQSVWSEDTLVPDTKSKMPGHCAYCKDVQSDLSVTSQGWFPNTVQEQQKHCKIIECETIIWDSNMFWMVFWRWNFWDTTTYVFMEK